MTLKIRVKHKKKIKSFASQKIALKSIKLLKKKIFSAIWKEIAFVPPPACFYL